jgi:hypothetical protein
VLIKNFKHLGHLEIPGGGQVCVKGGYAYIGHMAPPLGTSVVDVSDPRAPKVVAQLRIPETTHCHKARVVGDLLFVNYEQYKGNPAFDKPGWAIYDVSHPANPRELAFVHTHGVGVHRFDVDERYAYITTEVEGFVGGITVIYDLADPAKPREVSRWWLPGQWTAGGEQPTWEGKRHRTHHALRCGDRLAIGCWYGGLALVDIADITRPRTLAYLDWSPPYLAPTHTAMKIPWKIRDRDILVATDEHITDEHTDPSPFFWVVDISDESKLVPVANYIVPESAVKNTAGRFGSHQPQEQLYPGDNVLHITWFSGGLRAVDLSNPYTPREVGCFVPDPGPGAKSCQSNDVYVSADGLVYVIDRINGLDILARGDGRVRASAGAPAGKSRAKARPAARRAAAAKPPKSRTEAARAARRGRSRSGGKTRR